MPRNVSDALSVRMRGARAATTCGTTSATGPLPRCTPHPCLVDATTARQSAPNRGSEAMEPAEYDRMDAAESSMWWYRALHRRLIAALADAGGAVLDAGCGTGGLLAHLRS